MPEQSRRSFLQLVGGAAAAAAAIAKVDAADPKRVHIDPVGITKPAPATPAAASTPHPYVGCSHVALLRSRGLMMPCPNCGSLDWTTQDRLIVCGRCGWLDRPENFELPCQCRACTLNRTTYLILSQQPRGRITRALLETAETGFYHVVDDRGDDVLRRELNAYDVSTDGVLHHAVYRQLAMVWCAVYTWRRLRAWGPQPPHRLPDLMYQANGNPVTFGEEMVDCYEWQRDGRPCWAPHV
jgi:hypothetical protein